MAWKLLTRLLDSSKGRKPTIILRTQLSVRVNAILGEYMRALESRNPLPALLAQFLSGLCRTVDKAHGRQDVWPLPIPILTSPSRARADAAAKP